MISIAYKYYLLEIVFLKTQKAVLASTAKDPLILDLIAEKLDILWQQMTPNQREKARRRHLKK